MNHIDISSCRREPIQLTRRTGDSDRRTAAHHVEQERRESSRRAIDRMQATHEEIHRIATTRSTISEHYDEDMAEWADPQ